MTKEEKWSGCARRIANSVALSSYYLARCQPISDFAVSQYMSTDPAFRTGPPRGFRMGGGGGWGKHVKKFADPA